MTYLHLLRLTCAVLVAIAGLSAMLSGAVFIADEADNAEDYIGGAVVFVFGVAVLPLGIWWALS